MSQGFHWLGSSAFVYESWNGAVPYRLVLLKICPLSIEGCGFWQVTLWEVGCLGAPVWLVLRVNITEGVYSTHKEA